MIMVIMMIKMTTMMMMSRRKRTRGIAMTTVRMMGKAVVA